MTSPLTEYRTAKNKSLEDVGNVLGVNRSTILRWERGRVPVDRLADVESATGIPRARLRPDIFGKKRTPGKGAS